MTIQKVKMSLKDHKLPTLLQHLKNCHSELQFPMIATLFICINGIFLLISFDLSRGHIQSDWLFHWGINLRAPQFPQWITYWFLHFHLAHFVGVSLLLAFAGAYGEWRIGKVRFLCFYILSATIFAGISVLVLKILISAFPFLFLLQWFSQGLDGHMVGSSAAAFGVSGCIYPVVHPSHRPFYFTFLICAVLAPVIIFHTINVGDWVHGSVPLFTLATSTLLYNPKNKPMSRESRS